MKTIKPESTLKLAINGATLRAEKVRGKWTFKCNRWPDLAAQFDGSESANDAVAEFTRLALEGAITVKEAAKGKVKRA